MPCDSTVSCLCNQGAAIRTQEHGGDEPRAPASLRHEAGQNVAVVVLGGPHKSTGAPERTAHHVVNKAVLVPEAPLFKHLLEGGLVDVVEDIYEQTIKAFMTVFFVDKYKGSPSERENSKQLCAKCSMDSRVLYIPNITPPARDLKV
eukprot:CAMPEP_0171080062 /NCGR_PEP_ID=MMETSP0766_2-20121228/15636_1 /TAXON_ID=439317 /ORGANISM="Gambierdiscus australes, Strain CAWD 149" /LENGTH=146 /DNA_ID=CAMNT_0011537277 /DNA_START=365 /DNA_END=806 /DNA_ORIENTATION=-